MKQPCGCCAGIENITPEPEANRPGLPALVYRAGTHATFMESMLARITTMGFEVSEGGGGERRVRPLRGRLTTRAEDDPSIALMDAWATVADVLTFYQERIANEGYLRTATERRSILELARLIGYRLRPAVSASVYLAFTVSDGFTGEVPAGARAQSIPGTGEKPQFFETSEKLAARDVWNSLRPRLSRPQLITLATDKDGKPIDPPAASIGTDARTRDILYFQGDSTNLNPGDALLFVFGDDKGQQVLRKVQSLEVQTEPGRTDLTQPEKKRTEVTLAPPAKGSGQKKQALALTAPATLSATQPSASAQAVPEIIQEFIASLRKGAKDRKINKAQFLFLESWLKALKTSITADDATLKINEGISTIKATIQRLPPSNLRSWLERVLQALDEILKRLSQPRTGGDDTAPASTIPDETSSLLLQTTRSSPLENLTDIFTSLSKPPSRQPANALRLKRTVNQAFASQSDIAPRLFAAFVPALAGTLYQAWAGIEAPSSQVQVYAMRVKAQLFGHNAPLKIQFDGEIRKITGQEDWPVADGVAPSLHWHEEASIVWLDSSYEKILSDSWVVVQTATTNITEDKTLYAKATNPTVFSRGDYGISGKATRIELGAPSGNDGTIEWITNKSPDKDKNTPPDDNFAAIRETVVYAQPEELKLAEEPIDEDLGGDTIELAQLYDGLDSGRWIIVSGERKDIPKTSGVIGAELVMISSVVQGARPPLCVLLPSGWETPMSHYYYTTEANKYGDRLVVGLISSKFLGKIGVLFPDEPIPPNQQFCDQIELAPGIYASAYVPTQDELQGKFPDFEGLLRDPKINYGGRFPVDGDVVAWRISTPPVRTILTLANELSYSYDRTKVTIYGNVVKATHGQTVGEVLGNGDASQPLQKFALRQPPLTYLAAPTAAGSASTLELRVNEVKWHEAENLVALGANDRKYFTQTDDSEQVVAIFGNGEHGTRVPTGVANVKAVYRYGTGKSGNVQARQISQLATQPLGVRSVINPLRASGGADRDTRDQARRNVPLAVMALDRLVSVRDYADFARSYAGIGKARAARLTDRRSLLVHVTIAGKDDIPIDEHSDLYRNLVQALIQLGDPCQPVRLAMRRLKLLVISAGIKVMPDYAWESVAPKVRAAMLELYGFEQRELGQSAFPSEAISAMQAVEGVQYVDLRIFDAVAEDVTAEQLAGLAATLTTKPFVEAKLATPDSTATDPAKSILPAELVMLTPGIPDTLILTEITI